MINRSTRLTFVLLASLLAVGLCSCATTKEDTNVSSETKVYQLAQKALGARNWEGAIKYLELLEENYPFGTYGEQAQLELVYALFRSGEHESAIRTAERFIRLHPQHKNVDYAYYMKGLASYHQDSKFLGSLLASDNTNKDPGAARDSYNHFSQFILQYPDSIYVEDATQRMVYLRNLLARYEIHAANYYFKRKAYMAAANRGRYVVENFQGAPAVPDGLAVMAQAYFLMGTPELAKDAETVLAHNFPNHPALNKNGKFDRNYSARARKRSWLSYLTLGLLDKDEPLGFDTRKQYDPLFKSARTAPRP